eukprot:s5_g72.t1
MSTTCAFASVDAGRKRYEDDDQRCNWPDALGAPARLLLHTLQCCRDGIHADIEGMLCLVSSEWTAAPVLWSATDLLKAVKEGDAHPTANVTAVNDPAEAKQIEQVWKAYGQEGFWTRILTAQAKSLPNTTPATIRTFRAKRPIRIQEVAPLFLGDASKAVKTKPITKIPSSSLTSIQRTTIRIAAPSDFREPFLETPDKPRLVVQEMAQWDPQIRASALTGGRWSEKTPGWKTILTGFVDLLSKDATALTQHSGKRGIFVSARPATETASAAAGAKAPSHSLPSNPTEAMLQKWTKKDLEGNGDCMYRAVAGTRAWAKDGRTLTPDEARTEAAELRMAVVQHAKKSRMIVSMVCA